MNDVMYKALRFGIYLEEFILKVIGGNGISDSNAQLNPNIGL